VRDNDNVVFVSKGPQVINPCLPIRVDEDIVGLVVQVDLLIHLKVNDNPIYQFFNILHVCDVAHKDFEALM
jgi:hypothetical protein